VLAATERLLANRPVAELSVRVVCETAEVDRAQFGVLFADRGELLVAVFDRLVEELEAEMVAAYEAESCWRDAVRAALETMLARLDRARGLARFMVVDSLICDPALRRRRASVQARIADKLDAGHPGPSAPASPPTFGAEALVVGVTAILHSRLRERRPQPLPALSGAIMGMIVTPYLGTQVARDELARGQSPPGA
jgi:AcrR family transcriptional regulator